MAQSNQSNLVAAVGEGPKALLAIWLVVDRSSSLAGEPMNAVNTGLDALLYSLETNPAAAEIARVSILSFSDTARVDLPLSDIRTVGSTPRLAAGGRTSYRAAFDLLAQEIPAGITALKREGNRVYRPCVYFLTDGFPTDPEPEWVQAYLKLIDDANTWSPNICAFGVTNADENTCRRVSARNGMAFTAREGVDPATAFMSIISKITSVVLASASQEAQHATVSTPTPTSMPNFNVAPPLDMV